MRGPAGCGLVGAVGCRLDEAIFAKMIDTLAHRGPDGRGAWQSAAGHVRLGHRRLAIVGLDARGAQPMTRGPLTVACNGEIYNYPALRRELEAAGHIFTSECDVEVILHAFAAWGRGCVDRLEGIFAFALYDARSDALFLARDPLGVKPLVYCTTQGGGLIFASEAKALLASGEVQTRPDLDVIRADLTHGLLGPKQKTWLAGVENLEPGHLMIVACATGARRLQRSWSYPAGRCEILDEAHATGALRERLEASVRAQLLSDVGVSATCSGGVDSAAVTALMLRDIPTLDAFVLDYDDDGPDSAARVDLRHARMMQAEHAGLALQVVPVSMRRLITRENIDALVRAFDGPVPLDVRVLSFVELYTHIRARGHKVVLTGQGADELWLGYFDDPIYGFWKFNAEALSAYALAKKFFLARVPMGGYGAWNPDFLSEEKTLATCLENLAVNYQDFDTDDPLHRLGRFVIRTHLQAILNMDDKIAMLAGIEARVPWLDRRMVELSFRVPSCVKLNAPEPALKAKWILRQAVRGLVPEAIIRRAKSPFPDPPRNYREALGALVAQDAPRMQRSPFLEALFSPAFLRALPAATTSLGERELFTAYVLWRFGELYA